MGAASFYRDPAVWVKLKDAIIPNILREIPSGYILRVWIPACSTGEEAYS
ncbi:CheR family methyltransferase [Flavobacterium xanthum]